MIPADTMAWILSHAMRTHNKSKKGKGFRRFDMKTPYGIHPCLAALLIMAEPTLPEEIRVEGFWTLAFHDLLEETAEPLPRNIHVNVLRLIEEMTFKDSAEEMELIWKKEFKVWLYKLYDKVTNLLDASWMKPSKLKRYKTYTLRLAAKVAEVYPHLNIIKIARAICAEEVAEAPAKM